MNGSALAREILRHCSANSVRVSTIRSGAPSTASEALEPPTIPISNPRSSAIRAEKASKIEAGTRQRSVSSSARKRSRRSVKVKAYPLFVDGPVAMLC
jgi:hypothetical protein